MVPNMSPHCCPQCVSMSLRDPHGPYQVLVVPCVPLHCPRTPTDVGGGYNGGQQHPPAPAGSHPAPAAAPGGRRPSAAIAPAAPAAGGGAAGNRWGGHVGAVGTQCAPPPPQHLRMHQDPPYDTQDPSRHFKTPQMTQGPPKIAPMTSPCNNMLPDPPTTPRASPVTPQDCPSDHPKPPPIPLYPDHDTQTPPRSPCPPPLYPNCTLCPPRITLSPLLHHTMLPSPHQGTLCPPRVSQLPWGSPCNAGGTPKPPQFSPPGSARAPAGSGCG